MNRAGLLLLGVFFLGSLTLPNIPDSQGVIDGLIEAPVLMEQGESYNLYNLGDGKRKLEATPAKSKMMLQESDTFEVWGDNADGYIVYDPDTEVSDDWDYGIDTLVITLFPDSPDLEFGAFICFDMGTTLSTAYEIQDFDFKCNVDSENIDDDDKLNIYMFTTDNKVGYGGHSSWDSRTDIYDNHVVNGDFVAAGEDFSEFQSTGQVTCDLPDAWIEDHWLPGSDEHLTLWLEPQDFESSDVVNIQSREGSGGIDPTLEIQWEEYDCDSTNISGQDAEMYANATYTVTFYAESTAGYTDIDKLYGGMSYDHSSYLYAWSYDEDTDTFAEEAGAGYGVLNTGSCSAVESGDRVTATFNFTLDWDWYESLVIDYGIRVTMNTRSYDTGWFWDNSNADYENDLHLDTLTVNRVSADVNVEDGGWVQTSEALNITGYVYFQNSKIASAYTNHIADLWVDGEDMGASYNDTLDANGFFNITYTTPAPQDWDWSLDVQLEPTSIPSGGSETASDDNGKNPLFLLAAIPAAEFGNTGVSVTVTLQPNNMVPRGTLAVTQLDLEREEPWGSTLLNDGVTKVVNWEGTSDVCRDMVSFYWDVGYPALLESVTYNVTVVSTGAITQHRMRMFARNGTLIEVYSQAATKTAAATFSIGEDLWFDGRVDARISFVEGTNVIHRFESDQMVLTFTSSSEEHVTTRTVNGTVVQDSLTLHVLQPDVNVTIGGIPTTYSLVQVQNEKGISSITDTISTNGLLMLEACSQGTYTIVLDTGLTWHDMVFSPTLPDMLAGNWAAFQWYANTTHITKTPYPLSHGFYNLLVQDSFEQTILNTNFTITNTDDSDLMTQKVVPMYHVGLSNDDNESYYLEIKRGEFTMDRSLPPNGFAEFRIYGLATPVNYTVFVKDVDGNDVGNFTLSVPNHAISRLIDYADDPLELTRYESVKWVSEGYVQVIIETNWENCTITVTEASAAGTEMVLATGEGAISWSGDLAGHEVTVTFLIDGGTQNFTLTDRYYYERPPPTQSGIQAFVRGLTRTDLLGAIALMLVGVAVLGRWNAGGAQGRRDRNEWRHQELRKRGVTDKKDLHSYDRRKLQEEENKRFGKKRRWWF